jgi:hypothetical protein
MLRPNLMIRFPALTFLQWPKALYIPSPMTFPQPLDIPFGESFDLAERRHLPTKSMTDQIYIYVYVPE